MTRGRKKMKWVFRILLGGFLFLIGSFVVSFTGLPWKERAIANEIQEHFEEKYNIKASIKETFYNFKYGEYGAHFYLDGEEERLEFLAVKKKDRIDDTYGERLWSWQIKNDLGPILKKHISNLGSHGADLQYASSYNGSGIIPHYKDAGQNFFYRIVLNKSWDEVDEQVVHAELFEVIKEMKEKGINNIDIELSPVFIHTKPVDPKNIRIPNAKMEEIKTKEDIAKYVVVNAGPPY
jgi:hypothetical protein